jgi:hypothetical protein
MPGGDDRFKRYHEASADFFEVARSRAEEFLGEFARMGGSTQRQAHGAIDEVVEGSRRSTGLIVDAIRDEIAAQLSSLGFATKRDLEDLERRLVARFSAPVEAAPVPAGPGAKQGSGGKTGSTKAAATRKSGAKKAGSAKKAGPAAKEPGPVAKETGEA